jgi:DNA-binding MarR family transcriptional regulator
LLAVNTATLADELIEVTGPLHRALRRRLRRQMPSGDMPQARTELLGVIDRRPGVRVLEAASELRLAPNSVSTMVNQLVEAGLIRRDRDPKDLRSVCLYLTDQGLQMRTARRSLRRQSLRRAVERLDPADRRKIEEAMPSLRRLVSSLEAEE